MSHEIFYRTINKNRLTKLNDFVVRLISPLRSFTRPW